MIDWLNENAIWLGALGAVAAIVALFLPIFIRSKPDKKVVSAKNGGVASGGDMSNVIINTNDTEKNG